jgi:hypothetical protein
MPGHKVSFEVAPEYGVIEKIDQATATVTYTRVCGMNVSQDMAGRASVPSLSANKPNPINTKKGGEDFLTALFVMDSSEALIRGQQVCTGRTVYPGRSLYTRYSETPHTLDDRVRSRPRK